MSSIKQYRGYIQDKYSTCFDNATMDQTLHNVTKQIQWNWPLSHGEGEDHFVIVLGGLHIEMVALKILGDWLEGSGSMEAIV